MKPNFLVIALMRLIHDFFTVVWFGGMFTLLISYLPSINKVLGKGPQQKQLVMAFQKRHTPWVLASMVGLIISGLLLSKSNPNFQVLFGFQNTYATILSIKHILVLLLIGITLYRSFVLGKNLDKLTPKQNKLYLRLLIVNVAIALLILVTSGLSAAIGRF